MKKNIKVKDKISKLKKEKDFLSITLNSIGDGVIITDKEGNIRRLNKEAKKLTGWNKKEANGRKITEVFNIINSKTREKVDNPVNKVIKSGKTVGLANHTKLIAKNGREYHISESASPIKDDKGNIYGIVLVFRNITKEFNLGEKIKSSEKEYRQLVQKAPIGIFKTTINGEFKMVNPSVAEILGFDGVEELYNHYKDLAEDLYVDSNRRDVFLKKLTKNGEVKTFEYRAYDKKNNVVWIEMNARISFGEKEGDKFMVEGFVVDITERKKNEAKINYMTFHDNLTGLYNRAYIEDIMKRIDTERKLPISIIMADLNNLKLINDSIGHHEGDRLIKKTAEILKKSCRQEDIVARWGGDEFVVLLPNTSLQVSETIVERIDNKANQNNLKFGLSIAIGLACKENIGKDFLHTLDKAESRMYTNKLTKNNSRSRDIVSGILNTLKEKSFETETHVNRMTKNVEIFAKRLNLSKEKNDELQLLALLHDIGKISIPESILNKEEKLTDEEWKLIKTHPESGYRILKVIPRFSHIAEGVLYHHERWDGSGYPEGLKGKDIPLLARILTIVDAYDVMISGRPYKEPMTKEEIVEEFKRCSGTQFDPELIDFIMEISENDYADNLDSL